MQGRETREKLDDHLTIPNRELGVHVVEVLAARARIVVGLLCVCVDGRIDVFAARGWMDLWLRDVMVAAAM